jgi:hypothetical protein
MGWVADISARWLRVLAGEGAGGVPLDEAVRIVSEIAQPPARQTRFGKAKRAAGEVAGAAGTTILSRYLVVSAQAGDVLIGQLCAATGKDRDQVVSELQDKLSRWADADQLGVLHLELSASAAVLADPQHATYSGLGTRIEELFRLAEEQAASILAEARAQAAAIIAAAGPGGAG